MFFLLLKPRKKFLEQNPNFEENGKELEGDERKKIPEEANKSAKGHVNSQSSPNSNEAIGFREEEERNNGSNGNQSLLKKQREMDD